MCVWCRRREGRRCEGNLGRIREPLVHVPGEATVADELDDALPEVVEGIVEFSYEVEREAVVGALEHEEYEVEEEADEVGGELHVEEVRRLVGPSPVGPRVDDQDAVLEEQRRGTEEQDHVLKGKEQEHRGRFGVDELHLRRASNGIKVGAWTGKARGGRERLSAGRVRFAVCGLRFVVGVQGEGLGP